MKTRIYVSPKGLEIVFVIACKDDEGYAYFEYENYHTGKLKSVILDKAELRFELKGYKYIGAYS